MLAERGADIELMVWNERELMKKWEKGKPSDLPRNSQSRLLWLNFFPLPVKNSDCRR